MSAESNVAPPSGGSVFRTLGEIANFIGFAYIGLIAGSWIGTLFFKMRVLGFWDGFQDFGAGFYNPLELFWRILALAPGLFFLWLASKSERTSSSRGLAYRNDDIRNKLPSIVAAIVGGIITIFALVVLVLDNPPDPYQYAAYQCSGTNCRDHEAGYAWAVQTEISSADACAVDRSRTFREGCRYFVERSTSPTGES